MTAAPDIVERLRSVEKLPFVRTSLCEDAAAEIERLRVARARCLTVAERVERVTRSNIALRGEIDRLRARLKLTRSWFQDAVKIAERAIALARAGE